MQQKRTLLLREGVTFDSKDCFRVSAVCMYDFGEPHALRDAPPQKRLKGQR